jgi:hypothetical protein
MSKNKPDLRVIDEAISIIKSGRQTIYICTALNNAAIVFEVDSDIYREQFEKYVRSQNGGQRPHWWSAWQRYNKERLAALRGFRQACVNAAGSKKPSRKELKRLLIDARCYVARITIPSRLSTLLLAEIDAALN